MRLLTRPWFLAVTYLESSLRIGFVIDVHVANPFGVAQHRDIAALLLDGAHQLAGTSRYHQVDILVHCQQVAYGFSRRYLSTTRGNINNLIH